MVKEAMLPAESISIEEPEATYHLARGATVTLERTAHPNYPGSGARTLTDGILGEGSFRSPHWLGFLGEDLLATVHLGEPVTIQRVELTTVTSHSAGIHAPQSVRIEYSKDGKRFFDGGFAQRSDSNETWIWNSPAIESVRAVRLHGKNIGTIPAGHPGEGTPGWLFVGEILVR